jgi:hypothetical protein
MENLTVKMELSEDGNDECQNTSEYWLNSATWGMRSGALNVVLVTTDN